MPNNKEGMTRRNFLTGAGLVLGGVALGNLDRISMFNRVQGADGGPGATPSPTPSGRPESATPAPVTGKAETLSVCPPSELQTKLEKEIAHIRFGGIPDKATNILLATGDFKNTLKAGTEAFFAEPGGLLVGPDFESKFGGNPNGDNPNGWRAQWESKGHINPFDAETHYIARTCPPVMQLIPTNGFAQFIGNQFSVEMYRTDEKGNLISENKAFMFQETHPGINIFTVRGLFADAKVQNQDRSRIAVVRHYVPGTMELKMYKPGIKQNTAFVSEGQLQQTVRDAHEGQTNCGTGCSDVYVTSLDLNTGGWHFTEHKGSDIKTGWNLRFKSFNS